MRVNKNRYARTMRVLCAYYARASPNPRKRELVQTDKQNLYNTIVFTMEMQEMQHQTYFISVVSFQFDTFPITFQWVSIKCMWFYTHVLWLPMKRS